MSGEKTIQAEPLLEAKIVSIVSTSLLRGVEAQQHRAKSAPSGNLDGPRFLAPGSSVFLGCKDSRPRSATDAAAGRVAGIFESTLEEAEGVCGGTWLPEMVIRHARAVGALMARFW